LRARKRARGKRNFSQTFLLIPPSVLLSSCSESSYGTCYRCMMIYEKHPNVLQYKESECEQHLRLSAARVLRPDFPSAGYCEERIRSMEDLCNTIAGDAPLYTMFRREAELVKCPFRGPFSFSYSKGAGGQVRTTSIINGGHSRMLFRAGMRVSLVVYGLLQRQSAAQSAISSLPGRGRIRDRR